MAVVDISTDFEDREDVQDQSVLTTKEELQTSTLYNKDNALDRIIRNIKGNRWTVDYFLQLRDVNDTILPPDVNVPISNQKYHRINKLDLIMQTPISQDVIENITGEAIINAGITPNTHDVFKATLTGGREVLFILTEVNKRTYNIHEVYVVSFKIFSIIDQRPDNLRIWNNIQEKTMKTYVYDKDHLLDYSAPVILQQDYKKKVELRSALPTIIDYYYRTFFNYEKNLIALPTTASIYVDLYLTKFLEAITNEEDHELISRLTSLSFSIGSEARFYTIWDVILTRDLKLMKVIKQNINFRYTPFGLNEYLNKKMNYLGVNFLAKEITDNFNIAIPYKDITAPRSEDYQDPINEENIRGYYVLSENFYKQDIPTCGYLEKMLYKYLNQEIINSDELDKPLSEYPCWSTKDQFYLIPILIVLVKDAINNTFKSI